MLKLLRQWHSPENLRPLLHRLQLPHGFYAVSQGAMQPWREAYSALGFAEALEAEAVRLGNDPPDFHIRVNGREYPCELVEVRPPHRRIGEEFDHYASLHNSGFSPPPEIFDAEQQIAELADWLNTAFEKKARKRYPQGTILAVRAEIMWLSSLEDQIESALNAAAAKHAAAFHAIWISTSHRLYTFQWDGHDSVPSPATPLRRATVYSPGPQSTLEDDSTARL